jgi:hypothetical protein
VQPISFEKDISTTVSVYGISNRPVHTQQLFKSMMVIRYMKPWAIGTYVITVAQTWSLCSISSPCSRYG